MANAKIVVTADTRQAELALGRLNASLGSITNTAGIVGAAISGIVTGSAIRRVIDVSARYQDLRTTLNSVTGSAQAGAEAFQFVEKFATRTQFGIEELTQTYIKLQTAGIQPTEELLTTFTDAAAVTTDQLGSLQAITDLFSRTTAGGLGLEELNRLADRGIPVFDILQQKLGRNRLELSDLGKTAEGANLIIRALTDGINERFGGATANRIGNLSTQFSNLKIAIDSAANTVGSQGFTKVIGDLTRQITDFITNNKQAVQEIGQNLTQAMLIAISIGKFLIQNIALIGKALLFLMAIKIAGFFLNFITGVIGMTRAIAAMLIPALATMGTAVIGAASRLGTLASTLIGFTPVGRITKAVLFGLGAIAAYFGLTSDAAKDAVGSMTEGAEDLINKFTDIDITLKSLGIEGFADLKAEIAASGAEAERLRMEANAIAEAANQAAATGPTVTTNYQEQADQLALQKKTFKEILSEATKNLELAKIATNQNQVQRMLLTAQLDLGRALTDVEREQLLLIYQRTEALNQQAERYAHIKNLANDMLDNTIAGVNAEIRALQEAKDEAIRIAAERVDQGLITQGEYYVALERIEDEYRLRKEQEEKKLEDRITAYKIENIRKQLEAQANGLSQSLSQQDRAFLQRQGQEERNKRIVDERIAFEKKSELEKTQWAIQQGADAMTALGRYNKSAFEAAKAFNIANAIMNTYMGATKALATYPPPFNFIAAAAVVASGLAQVASIRSQQYSGRQLGGPVMGNKSYIVGEAGPEVFTPTTNGSITRNSDIGGGAPVNVQFTIVANDTTGFDELLTSRQGLIRTIISDAMLERGNRSMV